MAYDSRKNALRRQEAVGMDELVEQFIKDMKLSAGLGRQRAVQAWNSISGAGEYTLDVSLNKGIMTCVLKSSVVRNRLFPHREALARSLNECLKQDPLFSSEEIVVKTLILK